MELWERFDSIIWNEWFWFPTNVTWEDFKNEPGGVYHPQIRDLLVPFPLALVLYVIRQIYERYVVTPFGVWCGLSNEKPRPAPQNEVLEKVYRRKRNADEKELEVLQALAKQTDLELRQIQRWFRLRRNQDRPTTMKKFTESGWRFTFYFGIYVYGLSILWHRDWIWDSVLCWKGYPQHHLDQPMYWYYMIELGFYWSLMFSQFIDVKRKDFVEMFVHHVATIVLMSFSWAGNFVRVGCMVLVIHDSVDYWMEAAKMAKYVKANRLCDFLFAGFGIIWFFTRLVCYPLKVLYCTVYISVFVCGFFPSLVWFNGWLCTLLVLHTYWFSLIVKVAYAVLTKKAEVDDVRSSSEEPVSEDENHLNNHTPIANHGTKKSG